MRFELKINRNHTYSVYDHLFGRSDTYDNLEYAARLTEELNNRHLAEITALERQFL